MDNYNEVLEYLIELKKIKKEPNRVERDQFTEAWQCLVEAEGYSEDAEAFLYNGFTYCGASVVKDYVKSSDNPVEAIRKIFCGKMYGKNCASTVPILFHLLTLLLNEKHPDLLLISELFERIPSALKNKEGKIYGQADRALKKYILEDLHNESLPSIDTLIDNGLKIVFVKELTVAFDEIISGMKIDGFSKKCLKNIGLISSWLHPEKMDEKTSENATVSHTETLAKKEKTASTEEVPQGSKTEEKPEAEELTPLEHSEKKLDEVTKQLNETRDELEKQKKIVVLLKQQLSEITADRTRINELAEARQSRIYMLSEELLSVTKNEKKLQQEIDQLERKMQERMTMMEALSRDRARQSDEALNRLASKLRIEYRDFMDAVDIPMDSDLGENMREQLKNIFSILIKAGITMN
jgi:hypothetical protein